MSDAPADTGVRKPSRRIVFVCVLALVGLFFTLIHLIWNSPLLFSLFMIVGQGSFAVAILVYVSVILGDLKRKKIL